MSVAGTGVAQSLAMKVWMGDLGSSRAESVDHGARRLSDVIVQRNGYYEWIAIGRLAANVGETLIIEIDEGEWREDRSMCVIESRPFMLDGDTRHRIRLLVTDLPPVLFEQQIRRG